MARLLDRIRPAGAAAPGVSNPSGALQGRCGPVRVISADFRRFDAERGYARLEHGCLRWRQVPQVVLYLHLPSVLIVSFFLLRHDMLALKFGCRPPRITASISHYSRGE